MCDYSLTGVANRLAEVGDELVLARLGPHCCIGMAAVGGPADVAVCVPPGARLVLKNIPVEVQTQFCVADTEEVVFDQFSREEYTYRDGVRFGNGAEVILQRLEHSQASVISLTPDPVPVFARRHSRQRLLAQLFR